MKKISLVLILAAILGIAVGVGNMDTSGAVNAVVPEKVIRVTGTASVDAIPDTAYLDVGVSIDHKNLEEAKSQADKAMTNVIKEVKALGIEEENIKTKYFNVNPKYNWGDNGKQNGIVGYTVSNTIEIKITDIGMVGDVIDTVTAEGSNRVSGIRFGVSDETEYYEKALEEAIKAAESKALVMGKSYSITKLNPIRIEETSSNQTFIKYDRGALLEDSRSSTPVNVGEMQVTASVLIEYSY